MTRFERRRFFERLCQLQALYRLRGEDDATSEISIEGAIAHAEYLLVDVAALAEAIGADAVDPSATSSETQRP
jgi:hypothetical protein